MLGQYIEIKEENEVLLAGKEYPEVREELKKRNLYCSSFMTREVLKENLEIASEENGFVYMKTFGDEKDNSKVYPTLEDYVEVVRETIGENKHIYCSIGVHSPERLQEVYESVRMVPS
ncbi:hypothetical protein LZ578_09885 [Jeotgalibaca sp. MA1X17-3]|uniref:hypothetical protein n=1 Tax=Jeotgalibaca sp. MA1X17-3 TaxID=2908211 RepID=UPI001F268CC2|nr:hypothetical protein [Jeotgalibaca sp. MA1X17-3]UJF15272.1 hypothetical protein LZ578_09885 [Jeotgalibaca sp. MA1X17-3]